MVSTFDVEPLAHRQECVAALLRVASDYMARSSSKRVAAQVSFHVPVSIPRTRPKPCNVVPATPVSPAGSSKGGSSKGSVARDDPRVVMLHELAPAMPVELIPGIIGLFNGNMDDAAAYALEPNAESKERARMEARRLREEKEKAAKLEDERVRACVTSGVSWLLLTGSVQFAESGCCAPQRPQSLRRRGRYERQDVPAKSAL